MVCPPYVPCSRKCSHYAPRPSVTRSSNPLPHSLTPLSPCLVLIPPHRFVMTVESLLGLDELLLHQDLLRQDKLLPYDDVLMDGRIIFISHQYVPGPLFV